MRPARPRRQRSAWPQDAAPHWLSHRFRRHPAIAADALASSAACFSLPDARKRPRALGQHVDQHGETPQHLSADRFHRAPQMVNEGMTRHTMTMLALLALGCGGDSADECPDAPALPATDDDGNPWPTYSDASAELAACTSDQGYSRFRGTCSDGKRFLQRNGGFTGDTRFYDGETLVGMDSFSDIIFPCDELGVGDWSCERTSTEAVACP